MTPKTDHTQPLLTVLAKKYGVGTSSLSRHRSHHLSKMFAVVHAAVPADASTLQHLEAQAAQVSALVAQAQREGRAEQVFAGSRELRLLREAIAKAKGETNGAAPAVIDLQRSKEWLAIRQVVWEVLAPHPKIRAELGKRLLALDAEARSESK